MVSGLIALWRRPENHTGLYLAAVGYLAFFSMMTASENEWVFAVGFAGETTIWAPFSALVLAFPAGRLRGRLERSIPVAIGTVLTLASILILLFDPTPAPSRCEGCPAAPS